jgi:type I restriction enzyme S subunit
MNTSWKRCRIGDVCRVIPGYAFKSSDWQNTGIPVVKIKNIRDDNTDDLSETDCVAESFLSQKLQRFVLKNGDILVAMTGATAGKVGKVRTDRPILLNQRVAKISPVEADHEFIWALVSSEEYQAKFFQLADGAAQPNMSGGQIESVEIPLPPLPVQRRIASILSAYDELIENSQRRIRILETMARALYREWFVHFRFPGHEAHPRVPSPLGHIPKGWEVKRIGDVFQTVLGGTPSRAKPEFWEGGTVPWINSGKVNDLRITEASELITPLALEKSAAKLMPKGTTVLAITGATLGQVSYLEIETTANQSVVGINDPSELWSECIYLTVCERIEGIIKHASGGAQQHINKEVVNDVQLTLPTRARAQDFKRLVAPMFRELATLLFQTQNLRQTRDLLLPRLLSGQVQLETEVA